MDHDLISTWLQLPQGCWPPDHYTLLGLDPHEANAARVQERVDERMAKVRQYQLSYPDAATEAMNRLAQALICLTDTATRRAYDATLFGNQAGPAPAEPPPSPAVAPPSGDPMAWLFAPPGIRTGAGTSPDQTQTMSDWQATPPPARREFGSESPPRQIDGQEDSEPAPKPPAVSDEPEADSTTSAPLESPPNADDARISPAPRRKRPGTKRALFLRISLVRQAWSVWRRAGHYLNQPRRQLMRPSEATDLLQLMQALRELLRWSPKLLGQAGQPGYLVLSLARQQLIVPTLQTLLPSQREALARAWQAGYYQLVAHLGFLREELRAYRRRNRLVHWIRAGAMTLINNPALVLLFFGLLALNLAFPEMLRPALVHQVVGFLVLVFAKALWSWWTLRPVRLPRRQPVARAKPQKATTRITRRPASSAIKANPS